MLRDDCRDGIRASLCIQVRLKVLVRNLGGSRASVANALLPASIVWSCVALDPWPRVISGIHPDMTCRRNSATTDALLSFARVIDVAVAGQKHHCRRHTFHHLVILAPRTQT